MVHCWVYETGALWDLVDRWSYLNTVETGFTCTPLTPYEQRKFSTLTAPAKDVKITSSGAASDENAINMTFPFQWQASNICSTCVRATCKVISTSPHCRPFCTAKPPIWWFRRAEGPQCEKGFHAISSPSYWRLTLSSPLAGKLWTAPELVRMHNPPPEGTQKGDVYSFAIICQEIIYRNGSFWVENMELTPQGKYAC